MLRHRFGGALATQRCPKRDIRASSGEKRSRVREPRLRNEALWPCSSCQKGFVGVRQGGLDTCMEHRNARVARRGTLVLNTLRQLGRPLIHRAHLKRTGRPSELGAHSSSDALLPPTAAILGRSTVGACRLGCGHPSIGYILRRENTHMPDVGGLIVGRTAAARSFNPGRDAQSMLTL